MPIQAADVCKVEIPLPGELWTGRACLLPRSLGGSSPCPQAILKGVCTRLKPWVTMNLGAPMGSLKSAPSYYPCAALRLAQVHVASDMLAIRQDMPGGRVLRQRGRSPLCPGARDEGSAVGLPRRLISRAGRDPPPPAELRSA